MKMKYLALTAIVSLAAALSSCNTENLGEIYESSATNVSFQTAKPAQKTVKTAETEVKVRIIRANTKGEYTAHYSFTPSAEGIFTDTGKGQVVFKDGEGATDIIIKAANLYPGNTYAAQLALSEADVALKDTVTNSFIQKTTITVFRDFTWNELGAANFVSTFFEDTWSVNVYQAEGTNLYKFESLYQEGLDILFELPEAGAFTIADQHAWTHSEYGAVHVVGKGVREGKKLTLALEHVVPGLGSFGVANEELTLP